MKRPPFVLAFLALTLASACAADVPTGSQTAAESGTVDAGANEAIEATLDTYFQAVNRMDLELFLTIWADPGDVSVVSPVGRLQSLEDLEGFFQGMRDTYSEIELRRSNVSIRTQGTTAWVAFDFEVDGVAADGSPVVFSGWETQVQRNTGDGWRIAHVHYSVPAAAPAAQ